MNNKDVINFYNDTITTLNRSLSTTLYNIDIGDIIEGYCNTILVKDILVYKDGNKQIIKYKGIALKKDYSEKQPIKTVGIDRENVIKIIRLMKKTE